MSKQRKCPGAGLATAQAKQFAGGWGPCPKCGKRARMTWAGTVGYHTSSLVNTDERKIVDYVEEPWGIRPVYSDEVNE